jgi:hypothetical protein
MIERNGKRYIIEELARHFKDMKGRSFETKMLNKYIVCAEEYSITIYSMVHPTFRKDYCRYGNCNL